MPMPGGTTLKVSKACAASCTAAMACAHLLGAHRESMELFAGHVKRNPKNFYLSRLLRGEWPMPHYAMYRKALLEAIPETHFPRIKDHPVRLRILISRAEQPSWAMAVGLGALSILTQERPPGLHVEVIDASELPSSLELIEAVLASSAFPPFTPLPRRGRQPLIDGGAIEPIPMAALDRNAGAVGRSLVILTRPTPVRPMPPGTLFVAPDGDPNLPIWDYADEPGLRRVYEMCGSGIDRSANSPLAAFDAGASWKNKTEILQLQTNISYSSRFPNASELFSDGLHHGIAALEFGNDQLKPEHGVKWINTIATNYKKYLQASLGLLSPKGIIIVDNCLWSGTVLEKNPSDLDAIAIKEFNQFVSENTQLQKTLVPIRDGLFIIRKI